MIAVGFQAGAAAPSLSMSGWTIASEQSVGNVAQAIAVFYKIAGASESTSAVLVSTGGAAAIRLHIYEYTGNDRSPTGVFAGTNSGNSGASTVTSRATGALTIGAGDLAFATVGVNVTVTAPSWTGGFGLRQQDVTLRCFDGDLLPASSVTGSTTAAWTTAAKATAIVAAFRADTRRPSVVPRQAVARASSW